MSMSPIQVLAMQESLRRSGDVTFVNGEETKARWATAQLGRIQTFLEQNEWGKPSYEVEFTSDVLEDPFLLANGSAILWQKHGWTGVVRKVDTDGNNEQTYSVVALVVLTEESN